MQERLQLVVLHLYLHEVLKIVDASLAVGNLEVLVHHEGDLPSFHELTPGVDLFFNDFYFPSKFTWNDSFEIRGDLGIQRGELSTVAEILESR